MGLLFSGQAVAEWGCYLVDKWLLSDERTIFSRSLENEPKVRNRARVFRVMAGQGCPSLEGEIR